MNFFKKLQESLKKTSDKFTKGIDEVFNKSKPQAEILQDIEDILIQADVGIGFVEETENISFNLPRCTHTIFRMTTILVLASSS